MPTRYIGDGYWEIASRQMSIVTRSEQERFKDAKVTVIGCGGIGGETIEMLARMGIGELVLVDKDAFDLSNLNRQTLASIADLGLEKSSVAAEKVRLINPYVKTTIFNEHIDQTNIDKVIGDSDIVIDALDNVLTRVIVSRKAKEIGIPYIHGAIHGTMGQITVFLPNSEKTYVQESSRRSSYSIDRWPVNASSCKHELRLPAYRTKTRKERPLKMRPFRAVLHITSITPPQIRRKARHKQPPAYDAAFARAVSPNSFPE